MRRLSARTKKWDCLFLIALAFLAGCSRETQSTIRIGINAWPGYEFLYLAQEKGFYESEGLDVRVIEFNSLSDARRAYERGQIDVVGTTVIEVLQVREYSPRSPQVVHVADYSNGGDLILGRPGITNIAALKGKKVGVELGSVGVYVLARALEIHGLSLSDITPVSSDQMSMASAFKSAGLDAVVTYPPSSVTLMKENNPGILFTSAEIPGEVIDVIAAEQDFVRRRPEDMKKVLRAFHRAMDYAQKNPADAHAIMARREGITPAEFAQALSEGIALVADGEQEAYLRPGGKVDKVIATADRILRTWGQISGPNRSTNITSLSLSDSRNDQDR